MESSPRLPILHKNHRSFVIAGIGALLLVGLSVIAVTLFKPSHSLFPLPAMTEQTAPASPSFTTQTVLGGLDHPWDVTFLPSKEVVFSERTGTVSVLKGSNRIALASIEDVNAAGEGGLLGLAVDPFFRANRFMYACYNTTSDIRVVRWKVNQDVTRLSEKTPIITGMPVNQSGRHSGCRMAFGPDGYLWVGTGDTGQVGRNPQAPQDPKSLGGKILRVDRDGRAALGNLGAPFDSRIYSYGHRNTQGIAFLPMPRWDVIGYSAEHGSSVDDEINVLKKGNFGWAPDIAYTEQGIPMTDKKKFPQAIDASWRSGTPTQAPSGLAVISGGQWKGWNGALAMAMLKAQHLKILTLDYKGNVVKEEKTLTNQGRLRDVEQAPDDSLYVTTDNGRGADKLLRLVPKQ